MIPEQFTVREKAVYSAIPNGITNVIAIKNCSKNAHDSTIRNVINSLLKEGSFIESEYTYRDPGLRRPRKLTFYRLTIRGIKKYFPKLAQSSPAIKSWLEMFPDLEEMPYIPTSNAERKERALRVLETEMFCSAAGVLTTLDKRSACSCSVFGYADYPSVTVPETPRESLCAVLESSCNCVNKDLNGIIDVEDKDCNVDCNYYKTDASSGENLSSNCGILSDSYEFDCSSSAAHSAPCAADCSPCAAHSDSCEAVCDSSAAKMFWYSNRLCEAVKRGNNNEDWNSIILNLLNPSDPYSFYRSTEVTSVFKKNKSDKDLSLIRSQFIGVLANRNRGFVIYRTPRYNGLDWSAKMEMRVRSSASRFCDRFIPHGMISTTNPIQNAILFYQNNRELLSVLTKIEENKRESFGSPYKNLYAIPFTSQGLKVFQRLLTSDTYERDCLNKVCEFDPSFEQSADSPIFTLNYFGSIPCLFAFPLNVRKLINMLSTIEGCDYGIAGFPWQQEIFSKLLPDVTFLEIDI